MTKDEEIIVFMRFLKSRNIKTEYIYYTKKNNNGSIFDEDWEIWLSGAFSWWDTKEYSYFWSRKNKEWLNVVSKFNKRE